MMKDYDEILHYGGLHGCHSQCRIRRFRHEDRTVIVATELADNRGTSITNMAEHLCDSMLSFAGDPAIWTWIEHYPARGNHGHRISESFTRVTFQEAPGATRTHRHFLGHVYECSCGRFHHPTWQSITREEVERLTGVEWLPESYDRPAGLFTGK